MKICYLGDASAEHLRRWSKIFAQMGYEVHVITFNPIILDGYTPVIVHLLNKRFKKGDIISRLLNYVPLLKEIKKLIKTIKPDILHSHSAGGYSWMGMFSGFHPFIISPWGTDIFVDVFKSKLEGFLTKLAMKKADRIHCDGENTRSSIINLGIDSNKIFIATFGVDIYKFISIANYSILRKKYNIDNSKVVISTRTLNPVHNVESFVNAIPIVLSKMPDTKFIILGSGSDEDYLKIMMESLDIEKSVIFLGKVNEEQMIEVLQISDLYVSTSLYESGLAASTAEAMACELPVINTNTGDIDNWIENGNGGYIIPARCPEVLADRIIHLLHHDAERVLSGKRNREIILKKNNIYVEMKKVETEYLKHIHKS